MLQYENSCSYSLTGKCDCGRLIVVPLEKAEENTHGYFLNPAITCQCGAKHVTMRLPDEMLEERSISEEERQRREEARMLSEAGKAELDAVKVLTMPAVSGYEVTKQYDVITAEVVLGTGFMSEWDATFADFFGDRSSRMEEKLTKAKQAALLKLKTRALMLGANAVLSVDVDYHSLNYNLLMVVVSGTPVRLRPTE